MVDRNGLDIGAALSDPPLPEQAERLYSRLLERMKDLNDGSRRGVYLLLLVAACIELLNRAAVVEVSLGPLQVQDLSAVHKALPAVGGFLFYELTANGVRYLHSRQYAIRIVAHYQPAMERSGSLPRLVYPLGSSLLGPMPWHVNRLHARLLEGATALLRIGAVAIPPLLIVSWFWRLFERYGVRDPVIWLSLTVTFGLVAFASLVMVEAIRARLVNWGAVLGIARNRRI